MIRHLFIKGVCISLIILLISSSCIKKEQTEPLSHARIKSLYNSLLFEQIVSDYSAYPWHREENPEMFMIYCESLVESGKNLPSFLKTPSLQAYKSEFVQGYFDFLRGDLRKALERFVNLSNNPDGRVWGAIGLLEFSLHTGSITGMKGLLEELQLIANHNSSSVPSWSIPHYSAWYHFYSGEFDEVVRIIRKYSKELDPVSLLNLRVNLLVRENRFQEAEKAFKDLPSDLLNNQDVIDIEAEIVRLKYGNEEWLKYLSEKLKRFPQMWLIEQHYGEALIKNDQVQAGIEILKKLAKKRPFDITLQLTLAEKLLYYEKGKGVKDIFLFMEKNSTWHAYYYYLEAKIYYGQKQEENLQKILNRAREFSPKDPHFLSLMFTLAMKKHDYDTAYRTIKEILKLEPNDVSELVSLMELSYLKKDWKEFMIAEKAIKRSTRYISQETWDEIKSYTALALVAQKKFNEADDTASQIKNDLLRNKTVAEIRKLKMGNNGVSP